MKKLSILFLSLVALATTVTSCSKNDNPAPAPTALEITVKDKVGAVVPNAAVKLFASLADLSSGQNQVGATMTSDASGKVKFSSLSAIVYYFDIQAGCKTNLVGGTFKTAAALVANKTTSMDASLIDTALANFTNSSTTNAWLVTIGGTQYYSIPASTTTPVSAPIPAGTNTITMQEISADGTSLTGVKKDFNVTVDCGATVTDVIAVP